MHGHAALPPTPLGFCMFFAIANNMLKTAAGRPSAPDHLTVGRYTSVQAENKTKINAVIPHYAQTLRNRCQTGNCGRVPSL